MIIFDFLKDILYRKKGDLCDKPEDEAEFNAYITQRWLSMYSGQTARIVNDTTNRMWTILDEKKQWYQAMLYFIPKTYFKKIKYIKKEKVEDKLDKPEEDVIALLATNYEISQREIRMYIHEYGMDIETLKKHLK